MNTISLLSHRKDIAFDVLSSSLHRRDPWSRPRSEDPSGALTRDPFCATPRLQINHNPPFVGQALRNKTQSEDMVIVFERGATETKQDYVICWYRKALDYMCEANHAIYSAFVSTNSVCKGESVPTFWKGMVDSGAEIIDRKPFSMLMMCIKCATLTPTLKKYIRPFLGGQRVSQ